MASLEIELRQAKAELERIKQELRRAYADLAEARSRLKINSAHAKRVDRAYHDALLLAQFHIGFLETGRESAKRHGGITHCRWENAIALLRMARCHDGRNWLQHDLATIEAKLDAAKDIAIEDPDRYRMRLPAHARPD